MKAIVYTGVILMAAASIYGIADYSSSSGKNEVSDLYKSVSEKPRVVVPVPVPHVTDEEKITGASRFRSKRTSEPAKEDLLPVLKKYKETAGTIESISTELPGEEALKENSNGKKLEAAKKKKSVRSEMFSRAPLDEKYLRKEKKGKRKN